MLAVALLAGGCPVADPRTESWLVNRSEGPIEVRLELDAGRYGVASPETAVGYAPGWLREFERGEGVELLEIDSAGLAGTYRIAAGGFMVAHASLGRAPYIRFSRLTITRGDRALAYTGIDAITRLFQPVAGSGYLHEFPVTDTMLAAAPRTPAR